METEKISRDISNLPPEAQRQVKDFIAFQSLRYEKDAKKGLNKISNLADESFVGIWKDREDMAHDGHWLRIIFMRHKQEKFRQGAPATPQ